MRQPTRSQGTAIFMALLIVAIVTSITVFLMRMQQIDIRRTQMMLTANQAYLYSQGVIYWAKGAILLNTQKANEKNATANPTKWPLTLPPTNIANGQGTIAGTLQDAEGLINLNSFAKETSTSTSTPTSTSTQGQAGSSTSSSSSAQSTGQSSSPPANQSSTGQQTTASSNSSTSGSSTSGSSNNGQVFQKLLTLLHVSTSEEQGQGLIKAITAWVSNPGKPGTAYSDSYDSEYRQASPPYQSPHAFMVTATELRQVAGMTPQLYQALLPYIIALPDNKTTLNAQHAPPLIQQALGPKSQPQQASTASNATSSSQAGGQGQSAIGHFFLLRADVHLYNQHFILYALIQAIPGKKPQPPTVTTLWESFGTP